MCTARTPFLSVRILSPLVFAMAMIPLAAAETAENHAFETALGSITVSELGTHVDVLAADSFEGREAGSRGGRAAGGYLVQAMEEYAVRPAGEDGGYFQLFGNGYRNVLGMIEGRDAKLKQQVIVIGAHYDHVGYGSRRNSYGPTGYIHNGADDNASGTSGVLEVMQALSTLPQPPQRSILFAFWDGEEKGMLGSKHFVKYPTVPLKNIVLAVNLDMIGRLKGQRLEVYGSRTLPGLRQIVSRANTSYGLHLDFVWDVMSNSDHHPFYERSVPFLMFHTGLHENYHRPSDDAQLINREGMRAVSQLLFRVAYDLAESPQIASFRKQARFESNHTRSQFERTRAPAPPRLGVSWSREDADPGLLVTRVTYGSSAGQAGLRTGDRILEFDGRAIDSGDRFRLMVLAASSPATAVIQQPGETEPKEVSLNLRGDPVRIGISWDQDRAEPAMVILTRVVPGSAADQAGLRARDRIYAVDGAAFADGNAFGRLVTHSNGPFRLRVERHGILQKLTIQPLEEVDEPEVSTPAAE